MKNLKTASATSARVKFTEENGKLVMIAFNGGLMGEVFRVIYDKNEVEINSNIDSEEDCPPLTRYTSTRFFNQHAERGNSNC